MTSSAVWPPPSQAAVLRAQRREALGRHAAHAPGRRAARASACPSAPLRLQVVGQVARGEHEHPGRRRAQQVLEAAASSPRAERDRLPRVVGRRGGAAGARGDERPAAGPRLDQPARGEQVHGALDGDRARAVAAHQLAHRRQPVAGPPGRGRGLQLFHGRSCCVTRPP